MRQPTLATNIRFNDVSYRGESFRSPQYYGVRVGYLFGQRWGVEGELIHLKIFVNVHQRASTSGEFNGLPVSAVEPIDTVVQRFGLSHGVNLLLINGVFRQQLWRKSNEQLPRLAVVLRFGVGTTRPHVESTIEQHSDEHYQLGSPAYQLAAGIETRVWKRLYWSGEYKFTRVRETVDVFGGQASALLRSHHLATGPAIYF